MGDEPEGDGVDVPADVARAMEAFLLGQEPSLTRVQVAERAGVPLDLAVTLWHQLGFPHHADDDVAFAESDVEALRLTADLVEIGILPPESQAALVRTWGRSYARLAEWQTTLLAGLAVEGGDPAAALTELATDVLPRVEALQTYVWRRHLASAAQHLLDGHRRADAGRDPAVGLLRRHRRLHHPEPQPRRRRAGRVGRPLRAGHDHPRRRPRAARSSRPSATRCSSPSPTRPPPSRSRSTLTARGDDPDDPFPAVRAGIAHGAVVRRLGDVFGSTVNAASRLTSAARPGTVLVDAGVHEALTADEDEPLALAAAAPGLGEGFRPPRGVAGATSRRGTM